MKSRNKFVLILILTQNENLYLPNSFAKVCRAFKAEVVCIVAAPAMSTHGGVMKGFLKHFILFGFRGTAIMDWRVICAKVKALLLTPKHRGPFYSIRGVAECFHIPFYYVNKIRSEKFYSILDRYKLDLLVSISCSQIIGKKIGERFPKGCINVHGAPLPKYRVLIPTFWVLRNNETKTATTVHDLEAKLDDGDIILQREVEILPMDTWDSLVRKTKAAGVEALMEAIGQIKDGSVVRKPNPEEDATYFTFPTSEDRKAFIKAG